MFACMSNLLYMGQRDQSKLHKVLWYLLKLNDQRSSKTASNPLLSNKRYQPLTITSNFT